MNPNALVIRGDGINCEQETAQAFRMVGFEVSLEHINDLIREGRDLAWLKKHFHALAIPGGFSFSDVVASGKILALKMQYALGWDLTQFAKDGGLVLGICNGFQALIRLGAFGRELSITQNMSGLFVDQWIKVLPQSEKSVWLKGMGTMDLPIRHSEGRVVFPHLGRHETIEKLKRQNMIGLTYINNPNGSEENIAGLCDPTGRILGLMPHPEAFVRWTAHPEWTSEPDRAGGPGDGLSLFSNAYQEIVQHVS